MLFQNLKNASPSQKTGGFTLVEMLVVIVVIGLLAAIAVPIFLSQSDKANDAALQSDLSNAARMLAVAEASGETLPSSLPAGQVTDLGTAGTITPAATLTVSGSGASLCVEGTSDSGDVYSADLANGLRNYDCDGYANGVAPLVLSYADTSFTSGSNNETLAVTASGGDGTKTYSYSGTLPTGVTFDSATGTFTGPGASAWNFQIDPSVGSGAPDRTCVGTTDGEVYCWGKNTTGALGNGTQIDSALPVLVTGFSDPIDLSAAGNGSTSMTCGVDSNNDVYCWGGNPNYNILGTPNVDNSLVPLQVPGIKATKVAAASWGGCAVLTDTTMKCWGANFYGQLGTGNSINQTSPVLASEFGSGIQDVATLNGGTTCALYNAGNIKCVGADQEGRLGNGGSDTNSVNAVDVVGISNAQSLEGIWTHLCTLLTGGDVYCWGGGPSWSALGSTTKASSTPIQANLPGPATAIAVGAYKTMYLVGSDAYYSGVTAFDVPNPTKMSVSNVAGVIAGGMHHAVDTSGLIYSLGWNQTANAGSGDGLNDVAFVTNRQADQSVTPTGFPATVDVTVTDDSGSTTESVTLTLD